MMQTWQAKVWGKTKCMIHRPVFQEHELIVKAGGCCSVHYHNDRCNTFIVKEGVIAVVVFNAWTFTRTYLTNRSDPLVIPSGVVHRFEVYQDGGVVEQYWPDRGKSSISIGDIHRLNEGSFMEARTVELESHFDRQLERYEMVKKDG